MGTPKEGVAMRDGRAMIEHVADAVRPLASKLVVVGASRGFDPARLGAVQLDDLRGDCGPLAGIEAVLASGLADHYLFVTCDQPLLTASLLRRLLPPASLPSALRTRDGGDLLPFPCVISGSLRAALGVALDAGERSPSAWLRGRGVDWREASPLAKLFVRSIDTMQELDILLSDDPQREEPL